jgi:hypothetical protein
MIRQRSEQRKDTIAAVNYTLSFFWFWECIVWYFYIGCQCGGASVPGMIRIPIHEGAQSCKYDAGFYERCLSYNDSDWFYVRRPVLRGTVSSWHSTCIWYDEETHVSRKSSPEGLTWEFLMDSSSQLNCNEMPSSMWGNWIFEERRGNK